MMSANILAFAGGESAGAYTKLSTAVSPRMCVCGGERGVKQACVHVTHSKENRMGTKVDNAACRCCCGLCCFVFVS